MSTEKGCQKELRDIAKLSCVLQEIQSGLEEGLQQQLQDIEKKKNMLCCRSTPQKIQSIQDKKRCLQKEHVAAREEMRKLKEDVKQDGAYSFSVGQSRER